MGTRTNQKPETVSREEFDRFVTEFQKQHQQAQNPIFRAWSTFFFALFSNPRTTLAGVGAAIPVLTQAYEQQNYVLAVSGVSMLLTGALAGDAKKPKEPVTPPTDQLA